MCFLLVNLYEFGQFLRIFLWISLPLITIAMLVTTYFHYRRKSEQPDGLLYYVDGYGFAAGDPLPELSGEKWETTTPTSDVPMADEPADIHNENMYRGILWMKEKYEQYRDLADKRYEDLREELDRTEKRYQGLLASLDENKAGVGRLNPATGYSGRVGENEGGNRESDNREGDGMAGETEKERGERGEKSGDGTDRDAGMIALMPVSDAERESVRDIVGEKNRQIDFLQNQLEQRIKNYHQLEYQGRDSRARLEELEKQSATVQQALEGRQRIIDEQNGRLDEQNGRLGEMEGSLQTERNKVEELVGKLQANSVLMMNIYKELDKSLNIERPVGDQA